MASKKLLLLRLGITLRHRLESVMATISPVLQPIYWLGLTLSLFLSAYWVWRLPSAGVAIGALGAVGVLVAIKGEKIQEGHKVIWATITLVFLITEVRAIHKDRRDQDDKQTQTIDTIVRGYTGEMTQNQTNFGTTMSKLDSAISRLETLNSTTTRAEAAGRKQFTALLKKEDDLFTHEEALAESLNGQLIPASDPTPPNICPEAGKDSILLFLGEESDGVVMLVHKFPHIVLGVGDFGPALTLERSENGSVAVVLDIRGTDGKIIARLNKDGFVVNKSNFLEMKKDKSSLIITDDYGKEALNARYLNPHAFRINGILNYPDRQYHSDSEECTMFA